MRTATALLFAALTLASGDARAQQGDFGEVVEVRVANIDVSVTDKSGQRVRGLTREDFTLLVDGKETPISNFSEVSDRAGTAPDAASASAVTVDAPVDRRRVVAFVVDNYSLDVRRRSEALAALRRFADASLRDGDVAMLAVWNRRMTIPVTLTADRAEIKRELEKLEKVTTGAYGRDRQLVEMRVRSALQEAEVASGRNPVAAARQAYADAITTVGHFAEEQAKISENFTIALEELFRGLAGVEGKKIVVLLGENFPQYPALGTYQFLNDAFGRYAGQITFAVPQMIATQRSLTLLSPRLTRAANASEITLHTIYSGESDAETPAEVTGSPADRMMSRQLDFANTGTTMNVLSRDTGGVALIGSRNFDLAASLIGEDLTSYYSLGYRIRGEAKPRRVEIRTKNPSLTVRSRRMIVERTLDQEIADRVTGRLFQKTAANDSEITVAVGKPIKERRDRIRVPVTIRFASSLLTLLPRDGRASGGFEVIVAARDVENRISNESRKTQSVAWPEQAVPPQIEFVVDVIVRDMPGEISVGVVDQLTKTPYMKKVAVAGRQ